MHVEDVDHLLIPVSNYAMYSILGSQLPLKLNTIGKKAPTE